MKFPEIWKPIYEDILFEKTPESWLELEKLQQEKRQETGNDQSRISQLSFNEGWDHKKDEEIQWLKKEMRLCDLALVACNNDEKSSYVHRLYQKYFRQRLDVLGILA